MSGILPVQAIQTQAEMPIQAIQTQAAMLAQAILIQAEMPVQAGHPITLLVPAAIHQDPDAMTHPVTQHQGIPPETGLETWRIWTATIKQ